MNNTEIYVNEVNTIFSALNLLEASWPNKDSINFINNLKEYKEEAIKYKSLLESINNNQNQNINYNTKKE